MNKELSLYILLFVLASGWLFSVVVAANVVSTIIIKILDAIF